MSRLLLVVPFLFLGACGGGGGSGSSAASKPASSASLSSASMSSALSSENISTASSVSSSSSQSSESVVSSSAQSSDVASSISSSAASSVAGALTGVFVDSPVANLDYKTQTYSGVTNAKGEYSYAPGETVIFSIGNIVFPEVKAAGVVSPLDLFKDTNNQIRTTYNLVRLLITLDVDGNPDNGIVISDLAKNIATSDINFKVDLDSFGEVPAVINLIANAGQAEPVAKLVSGEVAREHFNKFLDDQIVLDLREYTAHKVTYKSDCGDSKNEQDSYIFNEDALIIIGKETRWVNCNVVIDENSSGELVLTKEDFRPEDFFNCKNYPICTLADFNRFESGADRSNRMYDQHIFLNENLTLEIDKNIWDSYQPDFFSVITFTPKAK